MASHISVLPNVLVPLAYTTTRCENNDWQSINWALSTISRRDHEKETLIYPAWALSLGLGLSLPAQAIVYTSSNEAAGNRVIAFDVNGRGRPVEIGSFDTQGTGTGAPIGNQAALTTDASDRWLFVTNAGDGSLTSFRLQPSGLEFVNKVPSGGHSAIRVTVFGTLVYVLNEGDGTSNAPSLRYDNISGFRFTAGGVLVSIPNSTRILDNTRLTAPAQIGFNKSGTVLDRPAYHGESD